MDGWVSIYTKVRYGTVRCGNVSESWTRILLMMNVALWDWFVGDGVGFSECGRCTSTR